MTYTLTGILLAIAAGFNAFLPMLGLALADRLGSRVDLEQPYDIISTTPGIAILLALVTLELFVDKVPRLDHVNDLPNSAIRPAAGIFLMMAVTDGQGEIDEVVAMFAGMLIAGSVHAVKAIARTRITVGTNGAGNPLISLVEDLVSGTLTALAIVLPWLGAVFALFAVPFVFWLYRTLPASKMFGSTTLSGVQPGVSPERVNAEN